MSHFYRVFKMLFFAAAVFFLAAVPSSAASKVPPVSNLTLVTNEADRVKLDWDAPSTAGLGDATIDQYIIKRNGHTISTLVGFNGLVDTAYVDGGRSQDDATYSVTAVDSKGRRSKPAEIVVPAAAAPVQDQTPGPTNDTGPPDVIQSSGFCDAIIPPNIMGSNQPTALEKYGCGKGMNAVVDSDSGQICTPVIHVACADKPRPFHDLFQSILIQLPVTLGHVFFLLIHALAVWVMQAGTYMGVGNIFAGILQTLNGDPNWPALVMVAISVGALSLGIRLIRDQHREGYTAAAIIVLALGLIAMLMSSPFTWMRKTVSEPLKLNGEVSALVVSLAHNAGISKQFHMSVQPTFNGDKTTNAIRQQENLDFMMFQYLPQCAINFGDYRWAMTHDYPGTRTSYCERFVQVWSNGSDDDKAHFDDALKTANEKVDSFFNEDDQMQRVILATVSKWVVLPFHNLFKIITRLAVFFCGMLLLAEVFSAVVWLLNSMFGTDAARLATERKILTLLHYFKVPLVMSAIGVFEQAVVVKIIGTEFNNGFLAISGILVLVEVVAVFMAIKFLLKMHHNHKMAMEARNHYRMQTAGATGRFAQSALALAGGAGAATVYGAHRERKKSQEEETGGPDDMPSDPPFDFTRSYVRRQPQLASATADRESSQPYDAESTAEEMGSPLQLTRTSGNGSGNGRNGNNGPDGSSGGGGGFGRHKPPRVDVDVDVDVDITDAEVVDGKTDTDVDVNGRHSGSDHDRFHGE
jgi:uncharacterized membrane protein YgcG